MKPELQLASGNREHLAMKGDPSASLSQSKTGARAVRLLLSSWSLLQANEQRRLDQKTLAAYCGLTETTLSNWTIGATELTQLETLLRLLERLPEAGRLDLLNRFLRIYPTLASLALTHDPIAVERLHALVARRRGVTFLQSARDFSRSFLLTALGHAATRSGSALRLVAGLDLHGDSALVPVPGVVYLGPARDPVELRAGVRAHWPPDSTSHLVLLNRLWCALPELQPEVLQLAKTRHLLIADATKFTARSLREKLAGLPIPAEILTVSELPNDRLTVDFAEA